MIRQTRTLAAATLAGLTLAASPANAATVTYSVTQNYNQVVYDSTHPDWDTIFTGTFGYDDITHTVSGLKGSLTQAMSGNTTSRELTFQLASVHDSGLGGWLVSAFYQNSTDVFSGGGFATGGKNTFGNQNAYVTIFVSDIDPLAALTQAQINKLAYADCTSGGLMMGKVCMTGWVKDSGGIPGPGGTMKGTYPVTQTISAVPEPESYAMTLAGLALMAAVSRRRRSAR